MDSLDQEETEEILYHNKKILYPISSSLYHKVQTILDTLFS